MTWEVTICGPEGYVDVRFDDAKDISRLLRAFAYGDGAFEFNVEEVRDA